jgi:hypothetical protein
MRCPRLPRVQDANSQGPFYDHVYGKTLSPPLLPPLSSPILVDANAAFSTVSKGKFNYLQSINCSKGIAFWGLCLMWEGSLITLPFGCPLRLQKAPTSAYRRKKLYQITSFKQIRKCCRRPKSLEVVSETKTSGHFLQ